jgi:hypothetical protein
MSFRRSNDDGPTSGRWLSRNRSALLAAGLPSEIVTVQRTWNYVLLHGDDEFASGWQAEWLSPTQASEILALITADLASETGFGLIPRLRELVQRTSSGRA